MSDKFRTLTDGFWVAPQIAPDDVAAAAAMGVTLIVNNRPDGEAPGQPRSADIEAAAKAAGIAYAFIPVGPRGLTPDHTAALERARRTAGASLTLAYCKTGLRSALVFAYAEARAGRPAADIIAAAAAAGYDIAGHGPVLEALSDAGGAPAAEPTGLPA